MLLNLSPPHNSTLPDQAMQVYASLGHFTRTCYGEGALPSPSALAHVSCYDDTKEANSCLQLRLRPPQKAATMTFDRVLIKEELSRGAARDIVLYFADGKSVFDGSKIGRTLIVLLDETYRILCRAKITGCVRSPLSGSLPFQTPSCEVRSGGGRQSGARSSETCSLVGFREASPRPRSLQYPTAALDARHRLANAWRFGPFQRRAAASLAPFSRPQVETVRE